MLCEVAKHCRFLCYRQVIAGFKLLIGEKRQSFREKPKKRQIFAVTNGRFLPKGSYKGRQRQLMTTNFSGLEV